MKISSLGIGIGKSSTESMPEKGNSQSEGNLWLELWVDRSTIAQRLSKSLNFITQLDTDWLYRLTQKSVKSTC